MKKKYLGLIALAPTLVLGLTASSKRSAEIQPTTETPIVEVAQEEDETKNIKEEIKNFKDTYIVPIFSAVFGTVSVGTIVSVFFAFKNRKTNKLMKVENDRIIGLVVEYVSSSTKLLAEVQESKKISQESALTFAKKTEELINSVEELKDVAEKVASVKEILITLGQIQTELAKINPSAVTSGVSKSLAKLNDQIKSLE